MLPSLSVSTVFRLRVAHPVLEPLGPPSIVGCWQNEGREKLIPCFLEPFGLHLLLGAIVFYYCMFFLFLWFCPHSGVI